MSKRINTIWLFHVRRDGTQEVVWCHVNFVRIVSNHSYGRKVSENFVWRWKWSHSIFIFDYLNSFGCFKIFNYGSFAIFIRVKWMNSKQKLFFFSVLCNCKMIFVSQWQWFDLPFDRENQFSLFSLYVLAHHPSLSSHHPMILNRH